MEKWLKQWWLVLVIFIVSGLLIFSGIVGMFTEAFQLVVKKAFLLAFWYGVAYLIRIYRLGHIDWDSLPQEERVKYYFILLIGSAMIVAWG